MVSTRRANRKGEKEKVVSNTARTTRAGVLSGSPVSNSINNDSNARRSSRKRRKSEKQAALEETATRKKKKTIQSKPTSSPSQQEIDAAGGLVDISITVAASAPSDVATKSSPVNSKSQPSPEKSKSQPSLANRKGQPSPANSKGQPSPANSKGQPSPANSKYQVSLAESKDHSDIGKTNSLVSNSSEDEDFFPTKFTGRSSPPEDNTNNSKIESTEEISRLRQYTIFRYSIGKHVHEGEFEVTYNRRYSYLKIHHAPGKTRRHPVLKVDVESVTDTKFFMSDAYGEVNFDDCTKQMRIESFCSFKVPVADIEQLDFKTKIDFPPSVSDTTILVIEFGCSRDSFDLQQDFGIEFSRINKIVSFKCIAAPLLDHLEGLYEKRTTIDPKKRPKFTGNKNSSDALISRPFDSEKMNQIKVACDRSGLEEFANWVPDKTANNDRPIVVKVNNFCGLLAGQWLDDTLVDFFLMMAISDSNRADTHVFSSYLYTSLMGESWISKSSTFTKKIDIFKKRALFIPIVKNLHWSHVVLLNLGSISREDSSCPLMPILLYFDSFGGDVRNVESRIYSWLNAEWNRIHGRMGAFSAKTMHALSPIRARQKNGYDCGIFSLKYAVATFRTLDNLVDFPILKGNPPCLDEEGFKMQITDSDHFKFDQRYVHKMRSQYKKFIELVAAPSISKTKQKVRNNSSKSSKAHVRIKVENHSKQSSARCLTYEHIGSDDNDIGSDDNDQSLASLKHTHPKVKTNDVKESQDNRVSSFSSNHHKRQSLEYDSGNNLHSVRMEQLLLSTKYSREFANLQIVKALSDDLDSLIGHDVWKSMSEVERLSHVCNRIAVSEGRGIQIHQVGRQQNEGRMMETPPVDCSKESKGYIMNVCPTEDRKVLAQRMQQKCGAQIRSKGLKNKNIKVKSMRGDSSSLHTIGYSNNSVDDEIDYTDNHVSIPPQQRKKGPAVSAPRRVESVLNNSNKAMMSRAANAFYQRHKITTSTKNNWPKFHGFYVVYNEIQRNDKNKPKLKDMWRDKPQVSILGIDKKQIDRFKEVFSPNIDESKFDLMYTDDPDKFARRLKEDADGNILSQGATLSPSKAFDQILQQKDRNRNKANDGISP